VKPPPGGAYDAWVAAVVHQAANVKEPERVEVEVPVLSDEHLLELTAAVNMIRTATNPIAEALQRVVDAKGQPVVIEKRSAVGPTVVFPNAWAPETLGSEPRKLWTPAAPAPTGTNGSVPGPQQKILDALRWYEALGVRMPTRVQVALVAGYSHTSGGYGNLLSKLRTSGMVEYAGVGMVTLTDEGRALATDPGLPDTNEGVQAEVMRRLPAPQAKVLETIVAAWPNPISREEVAERTGYSPTSGGYGNLLSKLRTAALIDYPDKGHVVALDVLFPIQE
jgi:hypothetical protein